MTKCKLCGKAIQDEAATFGPDCQIRYDEALLILETTPAEVAEMTLAGDAETQRWLGIASRALVAGLRASGEARMRCYREAKRFIESARKAYRAQLPAPVAEPAPAAEIRITRQPRGHYEFQLPMAGSGMHAGFMEEFHTRIGKRFRCWHIQRQAWHITPADDGMVEFIADIIRRHFKGYMVVIDHATEIPIEARHQAFFDATPKTNGLGFLGMQPR